MAKSSGKKTRPNVMLRDVKFVNKDLSAEFEVPELQKMSYSRRIILMKGIGVFKRRRRYPSSTKTVFENSLPQQLLSRKRRRIQNIIRHKPKGNKLSSIVLFIFLIILLLQIINSCDLRETLTENETELARIADLRRRAQNYLAHVYKLAEKPLKSFRDRLVSLLTEKYADPNGVEEPKLLDWKPRNDSFSKKLCNQSDDKEVDGSLNSGGTDGANLINTAVFNHRSTSTQIFKSLSNYIEPNPKIVNPIRDQKVACIVSAPKGSDAGIACTSKLLCWLSSGLPKGPCVLGKISAIGPVRAFDETRYRNLWQQFSTESVGSRSSFILSVKTKNKLLEILSETFCKIRLKFVSFSITQLNCIKSLPNNGSTTVVPVACSGKGGKNTLFDFISSPVKANDVQLMFDVVGGTNISWNIVMLPCRSFYLAAVGICRHRASSTPKFYLILKVNKYLGGISACKAAPPLIHPAETFYRISSYSHLSSIFDCANSFVFMYATGSVTGKINNQAYTVCFRSELISEKAAEKMNLPVDLINKGGDDFSIIKTTATNVDSALAFIQAHFATAAAVLPSLPPSGVSP